MIVAAAGSEELALFFHLLGAFLIVAGVTVAAAAFESARRRRSPGEIALLLGLARTGVLLVGIGLPLVLAFGLWLVHLERIGYGTGWVVAAAALFAGMALLGALGGRRPRRARELAEQLDRSDEGAAAEELRALLDDRTTIAVNYLSAALALAIIALMVFKPG